MNKNTMLIALIAGLIIVAAGTVLILSQGGPGPAPVTSASPTPVPMPTKADVLEKIDLLGERINASGLKFGGASLQSINGDDTAMVYVYRPAGVPASTDKGEVAGLLAPAFSAVYEVFDENDPLLVGLVDTTQKISDAQYKVDLYALERPFIEEYLNGNLTKMELAKKAILVTPDTESLRSGTVNKTIIKRYLNPNMTSGPGNYTPPDDREAYASDLLNRSGYKPLKVVTGELPENQGNGVMVALQIDKNTTIMDRYNEINAALRACIGAYGDYDRYMITMMSKDVSDYFTIDIGAEPVLDYMDGNINQWQLYRMMNLTYYTR